MQTKYFLAIIAPGDTGYGVYFPDLPGCISAGTTVEDAARNVEKALSLRLRRIVEKGEEIPQATCLTRHELRKDAQNSCAS
jgi:predicted RNase H-like HicB family nuclease